MVTLYLDANVFIDGLGGSHDAAEPIRRLLKSLKGSPGSAVTSELTLAEVLAGPEKKKSVWLKRAYLELIVWSRFIRLVPVARDVLMESARYRAVHKPKLSLPDAVHLVTAVSSNSGLFVTADKDIRPPKGMTLVTPNADGVEVIERALAV